MLLSGSCCSNKVFMLLGYCIQAFIICSMCVPMALVCMVCYEFNMLDKARLASVSISPLKHVC